MKVSRSLVDCSVRSETHSHQRVGRELKGDQIYIARESKWCVRMHDFSYS